MKKILITGANSYLGTSVEKHLARWPENYLVDTVDLQDETWRTKSFCHYDSVFHVAGIAHQDDRKINEDAQKYYRVNTDLAIETASKAKADGVGQFIFMSSIIIYGKGARLGETRVITSETKPAPINAYGDSKWLAEKGIMALQDDSFSVCVLRAPMIYGPQSKGNYDLLVKGAKWLPFFPDIHNERSMLHIDNLCTYVKKVIDKKLSGIHFPQDAKYVSTTRMVASIAAQHGKNIRLTRLFNPLLRFLSGKLNVIDKAFGGLVYDRTMIGRFDPDGASDEQIDRGEHHVEA